MILNRPASLRSENNLYTYGPTLFDNNDDDNNNCYGNNNKKSTLIVKAAFKGALKKFNANSDITFDNIRLILNVGQ